MADGDQAAARTRAGTGAHNHPIGPSGKDAEAEEAEAEADDRIEREYDVFLNDTLAEKLMLLEYPNRDRKLPYADSRRARPAELRVKPRAGLVEVDIPVSVLDNYDQEKAVRFGDALKKSTDDRAGGSLGLAGGFGVGSASGRVSAAAAAAAAGLSRRGGGGEDAAVGEVTQSMLLADFERAKRLGRVLVKQVLAGQIDPAQEGKPIYMVGVFQEDQLHLTPIDAIAQLRPQFHHLDAVAEQERALTRAPRDLAAAAAARQQEPRAVQMTVKSADGDDMDTAEITKALKASQEEAWRRLDYADENSPEAWAAYAKLFIDEAQDAPCLEPVMTFPEYLAAISACDQPST